MNACVFSVDPIFRSACGRELPQAAITSPDYQDIVRYATEHQAAVILYDVVHPGEWHAVRRLRRAPETRDIPLIILTAWLWADGLSRRRARELQCTAVLSKPCRIGVLADVLQRAIVEPARD